MAKFALRAKKGKKSQRRPTLMDVAKRAKVSIAAVSYSINGLGGIGQQTRERVLEAIEELGYRPNRLAQSLRTGRSHAIGVLLPDISNPFYPELAAGILSTTGHFGYHVFISQAGMNSKIQASEVRALCDHGVDGLILTSVVDSDRPLLEDLFANNMAFVQVIRRIEAFPADFIGADEELGARTLMKHLLGLGYRDIAVIAGPQISSASRGRLAGYRKALKEASCDLPDDRLVEGMQTLESGVECTKELLARRTPPPEAIACGNDVMALGAMEALADHGLRVPEDIAVVGYDDMSFASSRRIQLTTMHQPRRILGSAAVEALLSRIKMPHIPPREILLPQHLVVRLSCGNALQQRKAGRQ